MGDLAGERDGGAVVVVDWTTTFMQTVALFRLRFPVCDALR